MLLYWIQKKAKHTHASNPDTRAYDGETPKTKLTEGMFLEIKHNNTQNVGHATDHLNQ